MSRLAYTTDMAIDFSSPSSPSTGGPFAHRCHHQGCTKDGSLGYDRGRGVTEYWCLEHVPRDANGERVRSY